MQKNTSFQPTGVLAADILGATFSQAKRSGLKVRKFILHKKLYSSLKDFMAAKLEQKGIKYANNALDINGIPVECSPEQRTPLTVEFD